MAGRVAGSGQATEAPTWFQTRPPLPVHQIPLSVVPAMIRWGLAGSTARSVTLMGSAPGSSSSSQIQRQETPPSSLS
ncbi:MAG: hypothetical protein IPI34_01825 [bacterium]|nr:hypothetical protein [bacterium]